MASARKVQLFIDPRQSGRSKVLLGANVRVAEAEAVDATIVDISQHGFRAVIPGPLAAGASLRIELPIGYAAHANVVWIEGEEAGCVFLRPLGDEEVRLIAEIWDRPVPATPSNA